MNLELSGQTITDVSVSYVLQLSTDAGVELAVEGTLTVHAADGTARTLESDDEYGTDPGLKALRGKRFTDAAVAADGTLSLAFDDGTRLAVAPDEQYESWNAVYPDGRRVVCMERGELATWGPDPGDEEDEGNQEDENDA